MSVTRYPVTIDGETTSIGTAGELALALDVLQGQHDRVVLEQLAPHLAEITGGPVGFATVLKALSVPDQLYLIQAIGPRLVDVIQAPRHLRDLFATMSVVEVEDQMLLTLGPAGLRALVVTAPELAEVLEWLYGQCDRLLMDLLGADHLRRLIRTGHDLALVLNSLDAAGQADLIDKLGWPHIVARVTGGRDLAHLVRALPAAHSANLLDHYSRAQLVDLIGNPRDWAYLYQRLEPAEAEHLLGKLGASPNAQ